MHPEHLNAQEHRVLTVIASAFVAVGFHINNARMDLTVLPLGIRVLLRLLVTCGGPGLRVRYFSVIAVS